MMMMKFLILFISINKLLSVPIDQFQKPQVNHKIESYDYLEQYKIPQIYDALYQIFKNILKNPLAHIVVKENTPSTTEPNDVEDADDDEPYEDPVDIPEYIEEDSRDGILENTEPHDAEDDEESDDAEDDEPREDPVDIPESIEEDSRDGILENTGNDAEDDEPYEDPVDIPE